jgi:hypothetical protein
MRKIISFGISAMLILFAIGMWAVAQTSHRDQSELSKPKIATFELMLNARDLPAQKYDAF